MFIKKFLEGTFMSVCSKNSYTKEMIMKKVKRGTPKEWQLNPMILNTPDSKVQFWRDGVMITAQMSIERARDKVREGNAFVISDQAIGALHPDGTFGS